MSLTGHLDVFPLEEVLRLLARSYKSGCLRVDSPELHGRVYLNNGSLSGATVGTDDDLRRHLIASRVVTEEGLRAAEVGGRSLTEILAPGTGPQALTDLIREDTIESLYRIRKPGRGQFVFNVDVAPRYRADQTFDVELCVAEADRRAAEWADIETVIPTIDLALRINPEAPNNEPVTLAPNTWRLVAGFEGSATVRSLSDRLGMPRFRVAKDLAALVRSGLVEPVQPPAPIVAERAPAMAVAPEPAAYGWPTHSEEPAPAIEEPVASRPEPEHVPAYDPNRSWWEEPTAAGATESPEKEAEQPEATEPSADEFLDRVFSQLSENPEGEGSSHPGAPGHGFLKRRRMSSIGADE